MGEGFDGRTGISDIKSMGASSRHTRVTAGRTALRRGFTLIEAAIVTVIIAVGVVGMLELLAAGSVSNAEGTELTTAINLAANVREVSLGMAYYDPDQNPRIAPRVWNSKEGTLKMYDNVMDLDGAVDTWDKQNPAMGAAYDPADGYAKFSPPLDIRREPISGYANWAQWVKVETVDENDLKRVMPHNPNAGTARVTVRVLRNGVEVYRTSWLSAAPKAEL